MFWRVLKVFACFECLGLFLIFGRVLKVLACLECFGVVLNVWGCLK